MFKKKKSLAIIIGSIALAICLVLPLALSSTFSKYTKNAGSGAQTGTVAAFGVTLGAPEGKLFSETYVRDDTTYGNESTQTVVSESNTFAPGTNNGTGLTMTSTVQNNEVAVKVTFSLTSSATGWTVEGGTTYEPVKFQLTKKIGDNTTYWTGVQEGRNVWANEAPAEGVTATALQDFVAETETYNANDNPEAQTLTYSISWSWAYSVDTATDIKDTYLGDAETKASIAMTVSLTATQID